MTGRDALLIRLIGLVGCFAGVAVALDVRKVNETWRARVTRRSGRSGLEPPLVVLRAIGVSWLLTGLWLVVFLGAPVL